MPDLKELPILLKSLGYTVREASGHGEQMQGRLEGGKFGELTGVLRATGEICNVGMVVGLLDAVPERARYGVLRQLLELNFDHPLAHTSIVQAPVLGKTMTSEQDRISLITAETSFFWPNTTQSRLDARAEALYAIAFAASQILASRGALSNGNPFYQKLKGSSSPVTREDFPTPQVR